MAEMYEARAQCSGVLTETRQAPFVF
jgi:hypothetical protein